MPGKQLLSNSAVAFWTTGSFFAFQCYCCSFRLSEFLTDGEKLTTFDLNVKNLEKPAGFGLASLAARLGFATIHGHSSSKTKSEPVKDGHLG